MNADVQLIFETVHGSQAYGLAREGSDVDLKGVIVGPAQWYLGHRPAPEQLELSPDHVRYELRKLLRLLCNANPTVLELLFTDESHHRTLTAHGARLLELRAHFLTRRVGQSFGGYAMGQLKRIKTHRRWLLSPPAAEPARADFGLEDRRMISKDQIGAADALRERGVMLSDGVQQLLVREKRYLSAQKEWSQFQQWKKHRNRKRAELETKFGYDTKHAMHLIRLQRMGIEILERQEVLVERPDREELLAIRDGEWSYEELLEQAQRNAERLGEAEQRTELPEAVDEDVVSELCAHIISEILS